MNKKIKLSSQSMSTINYIFNIFKAFFSLFSPSIYINQLVEVDFQKELNSNRQLSGSPSQKQEERKHIILKKTIERLRILRNKLIKSFILLSSACSFAIIIKLIYCSNSATSLLTTPELLAIFSIFSFAWATLGRLGWKGQTFDGETTVELLDNFIFCLLYGVGTFLGMLAFIV